MGDNSVIIELLNAWEETYKKGQLTFWVFLSLKEGKKCVEGIKEFVEKVAFESRRVSKGPDRKYYYLTDTGHELFRRFVERNILIFTKESINNLLI